jgi:hypothetical protein
MSQIVVRLCRVVPQREACDVAGFVGDARKKRFRRITTAVSDWTIAALSAIEFILTTDRIVFMDILCIMV